MGDIEHKIRIVYKSGYTHDYWVRNFTVQKGQTEKFVWDSVETSSKPLHIGADEIAAVWLTESRSVYNGCNGEQGKTVLDTENIKECLKIINAEANRYYGNNTDDVICTALNECSVRIKKHFNIGD